MRWLQTAVLAATMTLVAGVAPEATAQAETLSLGVVLPQARFNTNAERSAYADRLAARLSEVLGPETGVTARAFARRADVLSFLQAKKVDLLVADGLLAAGQKGDVLAHGLGDKAAALYVASGTTLADLKGKTIAIAEVGANDVGFYVNTALAGELAPATYFGSVRESKDSAAALAAVKTNVAQGAFAPLDHPAAAGLSVVASGGMTPIAVMLLPRPGRIGDDARDAIITALGAGAGLGGGITGWRAGPGSTLPQAAAASTRRPRVLTAQPQLVQGTERRLSAPPIRLRPQGRLPQPEPGKTHVVQPTLEDL